MYKLAIIAVSLTLCAGAALAGATFTIKADGTNAQGSNVGVYSSVGTGNGDVIGGNGTTGGDQTTAPGTRAVEVQGILAAEGRGRNK